MDERRIFKGDGFDRFYELAEPYLKKAVTKDYDLKKIAALVKTRIEDPSGIFANKLTSLRKFRSMITNYTDIRR